MDILSLWNKIPYYKQSGTKDVSSDDIPYLGLTLGFTIFMFIVEYYISLRQLRNYCNKDAKLPTPLIGQITDETFRKTLSYGQDKLMFGMIESTFMITESIILVLLGYLPFLWDKSEETCSWFGVCQTNSGYSDLVKEMVITTIFLGISSCHDTIINLPFSLYSTFVVEQKHGFNKSTITLFFRDKALGLLLTLGLGAPILSGVVWLVRWGGPHFYFYVWAFLFVVSLILMTVYPTFIAPLFNKYEQLKSGPIYTAIEDLSKKVSFPLTKIFVVDGSRRSAHSNAYFYGFFKNKRIVLYDTLIKQVELKELLAILGHEMGHWKLQHTTQGFVISQLYTFVVFLAFSYVQNTYGLFKAFGFAYSDINPVPVFVGLMLFVQTFWMPVEKFLGLIMNFNSRYNEFAADAFSKRMGMGEELASGLIKISVENLGNLVPDHLYSLYHFSHPPLVERLRALGTLEALDKKNS